MDDLDAVVANKELFVFDNPDKKYHHAEPNPLIPDHPYVACLAGKRNSGKGNLALNLLLKMDPPPDKVYVVHPFMNQTAEWDVFDTYEKIHPDKLGEILQDDDYFDKTLKNVMIMDELRWKGFNKHDISFIEGLVNFTSSHNNLTILMLQQNFTSIPVEIRRGCNWWILWDANDLFASRHIKAATGFSIKEIFTDFCAQPWDSVTINFTTKGATLRAPSPFEPISKCEKYKQ